MSSYDQHPGGGYEEVKGYENPAGSMAEEAARMRDDEMRRQQQAEFDRQAAQAQAEQQQQQAQQQARANAQAKQTRPPRGKKNHRKAAQPQRGGKAQPGRARQQAAQPNKKLNTNAGLLAFVAGGAFGAYGLGLEGDARWFGGAVIGGIAAYIAAHYFKEILVTALVLAGFWFFVNLDTEKNSDTPADDTLSFAPAPALTAAPAPSYSPPPASPTPAANASTPGTHPGAFNNGKPYEFPKWQLPTPSTSTTPTTTNPVPGKSQGLPELYSDGVLLTDADTDFHLEAHNGKPIDLTLIHDADLDLEAVEHISFSELYDQPIVRMKNGQRFTLSHPKLTLTDEVHDAFQTLNQIRVISGSPVHPDTGEARTWGMRPGYIYELRQVPVVQITLPAKQE